MKKTDLRYIVYVRKSEERQERQALSIGSQKAEIKRLFPNLKVVAWLEESESAFKPGRPVFGKMMTMIAKGEAEGVICWAPNRLSRNEIDAASVTYALRSKDQSLDDLKFCTYAFTNDPGGILTLQIMLSVGQHESASKGADTKRGMTEKVQRTGEKPGKPWPGYMKAPIMDEKGKPKVNSKGTKVLTATIEDLERFDLIKEAWYLLIYDGLRVAEIVRRINAKGYRTEAFTRRDGSKGGGKPMPTSTLYRVFTSLFYTGQVVHEGVAYPGAHPAMVTSTEYDTAQHLLGARGTPRHRKHVHAFAGLIYCGECGGLVSGDAKEKLNQKTRALKTYRYYRCTTPACSQKQVTAVMLEQQIAAILAKHYIPEVFTQIAIQVLKRQHATETGSRTKLIKSLEAQKADIQAQLDELLIMRTRRILDDDEYLTEKTRLKAERDAISSKLNNADQLADEWQDVTERGFNFASRAPEAFKNGDLTTQGAILRTLGANPILKNGHLLIEPHEWLRPIAELAPELQNNHLGSRTEKGGSVKELNNNLISTWYPGLESNQRPKA